MVQTSLGMTPIIYEEITNLPATQKIKKKIIAGNGEWEDRTFIRMPVTGTDRLYKGKSELEEWCYQHYKEPRYLGPWCKVSGYIILDEKTYTHWLLCK